MTRFDVVRRSAFLLATVLLVGSVQAQQQGLLYISLLDGEGNPVKELTPAEVVVTADGVECKTLKVEPFGKPTRLTLMVDNGATTSKDLAGLRSAYSALIEALPEGVQMELITTAPQPRWLEKPTTDRQKLLQAIGRLSQDSGSGAFFDALTEAAGRADKDKGAYFPVFVMLATDTNRNEAMLEWRYEKLQKQVAQYGITVHFILYRTGAQALLGPQIDVGQTLTQQSGGRFETITMPTHLAALAPDLAKRITQSNLRQTNQFRVTYERPGKDSKPAERVGAVLKTKRTGLVAQLSLDGHMPPR